MKHKSLKAKLISWLSSVLFLVSMLIGCNAYASYLVYYGPDVACGYCYHHHYYHRYHHHYHRIHHFIHHRPHLCYRHYLYGTEWMLGPCYYCGSSEVVYYPDAVDPDDYYDPDLSTGDDNASVYPDMDIDE